MNAFTYNQFFVAMMNVINSARLNTPKDGHKHHIIPKCWFRMNNLPIDNSKDNLVLLSVEDHIKVHKLAYLCASDSKFKRKMAFAYHLMTLGELVEPGSLRGGNSSLLGTHLTLETRAKISDAKKGSHHSTETKAKMSAAKKGKHHTEEHRKKIGESMKGKRLSEETRKRLSEAHKGKHLSEEHRKKIGESSKERFKNKAWGWGVKGHPPTKGSKGMHWYNNGIVNKFTYTCPEGFVEGRLS